MNKIPYDKQSLINEIPRMEESITLFEAKIKELRDNIVQYRVWIGQLENEDAESQTS